MKTSPRPTWDEVVFNRDVASVYWKPMNWNPLKSFSVPKALTELLERTTKIMATLNTLLIDVKKFQDDVTAALKRAQDSIDALQASLASATLTAEQQVALDAADAAVNAADATVSAFDVPKT